MTKTEELLKVLDLPKDEQIQFLVDNLESSTDQSYLPDQLEALAFRLRDEVLSSGNGTMKWVAGMFDVYMKMTGSKLLNWKWGYVKAQPIHWIIAALIAKVEKP